MDLKAKILEEKAKLTKKTTGAGESSSGQFKNLKSKRSIKEQNKGVEERIRRDEEEAAKLQPALDAGGNIDHRRIELKLAEKAELYDKMSKDKKTQGNLVDFELKRW